MLISTNIRKKLTVLAIGSSLLAGCASGPEMRFTRFWPGRDKTQSAANDEVLAEKWRDRLAASNSSAQDTSGSANDVFATAKSEQEAEESRSSRFNIFRRFSRNNDEEKVADSKSDVSTESGQQRLLLERRIAELEAEQRALAESRTAARQSNYPAASRSDELNDPFLAATKKAEQTPAQPTPAPQVQEPNLPDWARAVQQTESAPQTPVREAAPEDIGNEFAPGFEDTLRNLQASAAEDLGEDAEALNEEMEEQPELASKRAPSMPSEETIDAAPVPETRVVKNPFVDVEHAESPAEKSASQPVASHEPMLETPISEQGNTHPLAVNKSALEQQQAWARIEVQQLMKRSRIQARAGEFQDALSTAESAEQLANSAKVEFALREQTPAQLISLIKMKSAETTNVAETAQPKASPDQAGMNIQSAPATKGSSRSKSAAESPLPQWPSRHVAAQPQQVADTPVSAVTVKPASTRASENHFKTAQFLNPRPSQATSPGTTSDTQAWYSTDEKPQSKGGFMEVSRSPRRSSNSVQARLISSSHIYSPENLQWTKLDASLATIRENDPVPMPTPAVNSEERPVFVDEQNEELAASDDIFAGFADAEMMEETLESDAPLSEDAPVAPSGKSASNKDAETTIMGIPLHKLALVGLASLILMAAIYHRRRAFSIHDV